MSDVTIPPRRLPVVGAVLDLTGAMIRIGGTGPVAVDQTIRLRVERVRTNISVHYGGDWVWINAQPVDGHGDPDGLAAQYLVACDAIPDDAVAATSTQTRRPG